MSDWSERPFATLGSVFESEIGAFTSRTVSDIIPVIAPVVELGVTAYFMWYAWMILTGRSRRNLMDFIVEWLKVAVIANVALSAPLFMQLVVGFFSTMDGWLIAAIPMGSLTPADTAWSAIDRLGGQAWSMVARVFAVDALFSMANLGAHIACALMAAGAAIGVFYLAGFGLQLVVINKIMLVILLGLGPLFLCCLMFPATRGFCLGWARSLCASILTLVMFTAVAGFLITVSDSLLASMFADVAAAGTNALAAVSADFVLMTEDAQLSLDLTGKNAGADANAKNGTAALVVKDTQAAIAKARELVCYLPSNNIAKARELVCYLPSNNLTAAPESFEEEPKADHNCIVSKTVDGGSKFKLADAFGDAARIRLARLGGSVIGVVRTVGKQLDAASAEKIAGFVRFCDAFSLPVITFADCGGFDDLKSACKLTAAYAEATTVKISVVVGKAIGSAYVALAGSGANADVVYAFPQAVISPVNTEAAAFIIAPDKMKVPANEQHAVAEQFAQETLSAFYAAQNGFVDGIVEETELRSALLAALDMLAGKRVPTVAKKHSTI